jgi:pyruvate/2-oxoglutarate dehydrogenase complex dihydrolipoamide dehydrogenase (E3) component
MSDLPPLQPYDIHNQTLQANVRPSPWINPQPTQPYQLVVFGAGTAGLVTAAGAAGLGARVALIERELLGGDCLISGCVPSKGLISSARIAACVRNARPFGINISGDVSIDFTRAMERMRRLRAQLSLHDSAQRFSSLGIDLFFGEGSFVNGNTATVTAPDGSVTQLNFKKAVIATGARAAIPPIPGLETVQYLTNRNLFSLSELPNRLAIVGSGPIGCEMAQTFARLGSEVSLFERNSRILPREDSDASEVLQSHFEQDRIKIHLAATNMLVSPDQNGLIRLQVTQNDQIKETTVDRLLIAVGRTPNIAGLNLEAAGVRYDQTGVQVNDYLQTTNPYIFAAGDICSRHQFTHAADFQARIVIQNALFAVGALGRRRLSKLVIPWTTFTSPEVASVGLNTPQAQEAGIDVDTYIQPLSHNDRAILESQDSGFIKVLTRKGTGKIIGATIVAENAGEMISTITLAICEGLSLGKIGSVIHPYPTQAEAIRKLGDQFNRTKLTPTTKRLLLMLLRWNVGR